MGQFLLTHSILFSPDGARLRSRIMLIIFISSIQHLLNTFWKAPDFSLLPLRGSEGDPSHEAYCAAHICLECNMHGFLRLYILLYHRKAIWESYFKADGEMPKLVRKARWKTE